MRTCGIAEESYLIGGVGFVILDVGSQKLERRKWVHAFEVRKGVVGVRGRGGVRRRPDASSCRETAAGRSA